MMSCADEYFVLCPEAVSYCATQRKSQPMNSRFAIVSVQLCILNLVGAILKRRMLQ